MEVIYFRPKGIKEGYCEAGIIHESDKNYIWYLDEPCKILISEVEIVPKENVIYDRKTRTCQIIKMKPTQRQKEFICSIIKELESIRDTNDINSPTHHNDIEEGAEQICKEYEELTYRDNSEVDTDAEKLNDSIIEILKIARKIK